jgi:hypothetical protein
MSRTSLVVGIVTLVIAAAGAHAGAQVVTESPFRCDMSMLSAETIARKDAIGLSLLKKKVGQSALPNGYEFRFPGDGQTIADVAEWIVTERLCCPFFDFDMSLSREGGTLALRLTGRPGTKAFIEADFTRWMK